MNFRKCVNSSDESPWITRAEACRRLAVGPETLERLVRDGRLSVRRIPGALPRLVAAEVNALIEAYTSRANA
ncbi:MAG TPA: excisionase family DNA-binding protein [Isosphaeraceae bacterium]|jgi:excisionase family DNA binding protein|nr:excisionase family DNA-binding protein [Isosphaeraceae bacterium]